MRRDYNQQPSHAIDTLIQMTVMTGLYPVHGGDAPPRIMIGSRLLRLLFRGDEEDVQYVPPMLSRTALTMSSACGMQIFSILRE